VQSDRSELQPEVKRPPRQVAERPLPGSRRDDGCYPATERYMAACLTKNPRGMKGVKKKVEWTPGEKRAGASDGEDDKERERGGAGEKRKEGRRRKRRG